MHHARISLLRLTVEIKFTMNTFNLYPNPPVERLRELYIGKQLSDIPTPAAILDKAVVKRNCKQMLKACEALNVRWRPHVKTHKVKQHDFALV